MTTSNDPMANVECPIARDGYTRGHNGIEIAELWIAATIDAALTVRQARTEDPTAFPDYGDATPEETARRAVARLLDSGWRPPDGECLDVSALV